MPGWLLGCTWLLIISAETALLGALGADAWSLQTPLAMTVLLASYREFVPGAAVLAGMLVPIEWLTASPMGHYSLGLVVLFMGIHGLQQRIRGDRGVLDRLTVGSAALLHPLMVSLSVAVLENSTLRPLAGSWSMVAGTIGLPILIAPMRSAMQRLDASFDSSAFST